MAILVTGASGFLGRAVLAELAALGEALVLLLRPGAGVFQLPACAQLVAGDVTAIDDVGQAMSGCRAVVHLATCAAPAGGAGGPSVDLAAIRNVVRTASFGGIERIVLTSSVLAMEQTAGLAGLPRRSPLRGRVEALAYAREQAAQGAPIVFLHPAPAFGPGPRRPSAFLNRMLERLLAGRPSGWSGPDDRPLALGFTLDIARAHRLALEHGETGRPYVLGTAGLTLATWLDLAAEVAGVKVAAPPGWLGRWGTRLAGGAGGLAPGAAEALGGGRDHDSDRSESDLGWSRTPLREALGRTIAALRAGEA